MKFDTWDLPPAGARGGEELIRAGYSPLCALILAGRGITGPAQAAALLRCGEEMLHDPFLMRDMDKAVERIRLALERGEHIAVYGDYDVDGITATCLLTDYLRTRGAAVTPYIPDRLEEGYGVNAQAVKKLGERGVTLIVTVDCGITVDAEARLAKTLGMELVITDHHECKESLPQAAAVVDPRRRDCPYPFKELAGVGVALKLVLALAGPEERRGLLDAYAALAAIGTVADVMPVTGENRAIIARGFARLENPDDPGLRMLLQEAGVSRRELTDTTIGYVLAPRINASGRMGRADMAVELFLTRNEERAEELAKQLCELNRRRQSIELAILEECLARLDRLDRLPAAIVLWDESWHQGVAGIVASRLMERYRRPVFMICLTGDRGKGSCRAPEGVNLFRALKDCAHLLEGFGGHERAAGFTITRENIPAFRAAMEDFAAGALPAGRPALALDGEITELSLLSLENVESLSALAPFGAGNPSPTLLLRSCRVLAAAGVGGGKHLKLRLAKGEEVFDAIFFSVTPEQAGVTAGGRIDIAFRPQINEFRDRRTVQLQLVDLRPAQTRFQAELALYLHFSGGGAISRQEALALRPTREEFAAVWRYLIAQKRHPVEDTSAHLARAVAKTYRRRETLQRTLVCLNVMAETGLIELERVADHLRISVNRGSGKVDLEQAALMRRLRDILES